MDCNGVISKNSVTLFFFIFTDGNSSQERKDMYEN